MSGILRLRIGLVAAPAIALAALACFSEKGGTTQPMVSAPCEVPLSLIEAGHTVIAMRDYRFFPESIEVPVGATVSWVDCAPTTEDPHTTTSNAGVWGSSFMSTGDVFSFEFTSPGTFAYHCIPHRSIGMIGTVVVD